MITHIPYLNHLVEKYWEDWAGKPVAGIPDLQWAVFVQSWDQSLDKNILLLCFDKKDSEPCLVAKVCRLPVNNWALEREFDNLSLMWKYLGSLAPLHLQKCMPLQGRDKQQAFITNYISGNSLLSLEKYMLTHQRRNTFHKISCDASKVLSLCHHSTCVPLEGNEKPDSAYFKKIELFRSLYPLQKTEEVVLETLNTIIEQQIDVATRKVFLHADFWHGNILLNPAGDLVVIDWQVSRWATDVSLDVYLFMLAALLKGTSYFPEKSRLDKIASTLKQWRVELIPNYLKTYSLPDGCTLLPESYGMILCCIEMAIRPIAVWGRQEGDAVWYLLFRQLIKTIK